MRILVAMPAYSCRVCGTGFTVPQHVVDRYPGWTPRLCLDHRDAGAGVSPRPSARRRARARPELLTPAEVLERYRDGPRHGVFTDGGAVPNPGPGGWGAVYVSGGEIVGEAHGHEPATTNNRMELTALIEGAALVPPGTAVTVYSDSQLAVQTITEWARGWEQRGWKRKSGPVKNLDLVKRAYVMYRDRPEFNLKWIAGHAGALWNEYADALAATWRRES